MSNIIFSLASEKLIKINDELTEFGLSLVLDYKNKIQNLNKIYSFTGKSLNKLTLCLIKKSGIDTCNNNSPDAKQQCVSSIEMDIFKGDDMQKVICEISSKTKPLCEGRRYNTFLRSVLIFIANMITLNSNPVTTILSLPINSISIWLLVSSYYTNNKYGKKYGNKYIEAKKSFSPEDFKGLKSSNLFNNVRAKANSTKKNNKSNIIPSKLNNKNTKKITPHNIITNITNIKNNKALNAVQLNKSQLKSIVESITEIEIDIGSETTHGKDNIAIAEAKMNEFIDNLTEAELTRKANESTI
jgi:hypothetical protein